MSLQTSIILNDSNNFINFSNVELFLPVSLGISNDLPDILVSILNKTIDSIKENEISNIIIHNTAMSRKTFSLINFVRYRTSVFELVVFILFATISITVMLVFRARTNVRQFEILSKKNYELEKANAAKTEFFSRMSHDMCTPMNGIIGLTEISKEMNLSPETYDIMQKIYASGKYFLSLINDTLDMDLMEKKKNCSYKESL